MKYIIAILCVGLVGALTSEKDPYILEIIKKCKEENNPPDNFHDMLKTGELPEDRNSLCTLHCIESEIGFIYPNNTVDTEKLKSILVKYDLSEEAANIITNDCSSSVNDIEDKCEAAGALFKCTANHMNYTSHCPMKQAFTKCIEENNPPEGFKESLKNHELIEDRASTCTLACVNSELDVMLPNNSLNVDKFDALLQQLPIDKDKVATIVEKCSDSTNDISDKCDAAKALYACTVEYLK